MSDHGGLWVHIRMKPYQFPTQSLVHLLSCLLIRHTKQLLQQINRCVWLKPELLDNMVISSIVVAVSTLCVVDDLLFVVVLVTR